MIKFHVNPGEEVIETVTKNLQVKGIKDGAIVSIIGAVDECCISFMPKKDAKKYNRSNLLPFMHKCFLVSFTF